MTSAKNQANQDKKQDAPPVAVAQPTLTELAALKAAEQEGAGASDSASFPKTDTSAPGSEGSGEQDQEENGKPSEDDEPVVHLTPEGAPVLEAGKLLAEVKLPVVEQQQFDNYTAEEQARIATAINSTPPAARGMTSSIVQIDEAPLAKVQNSGVSGTIVGGSEKNPLIFGDMATLQKVQGLPVTRTDGGAVPKVYPANVSILGKSILRQLDEYADLMNPRKTTSMETINQNQVALFRSLTTTINKLGNDFQYVWAGILAAFLENKNSAFDEINVFRGAQTIPLTADERNTFYQLLNLIKITAAPQGRSDAIRQVDPSVSLSTGTVLSHDGREKVMKFYNR